MTLFYLNSLLRIIQLYIFPKFFSFIYVTFKISILSNHTEHFKNNAYYILSFFILVVLTKLLIYKKKDLVIFN